MTDKPIASGPPQTAEADRTTGEASGPKRRGRRRLLKAAVATGAAVVGASTYVQPSVRPLEIPVAHSFSF